MLLPPMKLFRFFFVLFTSIFFFSFSSAQYMVTTEKIEDAKRAGEFNSFSATISSGIITNTITIQLPYDVPYPAYYFSEEKGILVLVHSFHGFMDVYSSNAKKIWSQNFFKDVPPNYERTISCAVGTSSIAILTSDVTLANAKVYKYLYSGAKQWETELPFSLGMNISMSPNEQTIVAGSYFVLEDEVRKSAAIISAKGKIEGDADILFRNAAFSSDSKFIALTSEREVVVISNETKKELSRTGKVSEGIITDVIWNGDNLIVQESEVKTTPDHAFYFSNPTIIIYSEKLKEISRQRIETTEFRTSSLRKKGSDIQLNINGNTIPITRLR